MPQDGEISRAVAVHPDNIGLFSITVGHSGDVAHINHGVADHF